MKLFNVLNFLKFISLSIITISGLIIFQACTSPSTNSVPTQPMTEGSKVASSVDGVEFVDGLVQA